MVSLLSACVVAACVASQARALSAPGGGGGGGVAAGARQGSREGAAPVTLSRFMLEETRRDESLMDLEALMASIQMACKTISSLVQRAGLSDLTGLAAGGGSVNVQGEEQKKLDLVTNDVLKDALGYTGRVGLLASEEEALPVLVEETLDSRYVAVFDPLDGSSNVDAAIATGTIFGIFELDDACVFLSPEPEDGSANATTLDDRETSCLLSALRSGESLVAAGYCMYSSSTILVFTTGDGVNGFTLDPKTNEFVLSHRDLQIPKSGPYYSFNEGNAPHWDDAVTDYLDALKTGTGKQQKAYGARYIGSMVADVHRTLLYGGIYGYPADAKHAQGKLRLLYEAAPMSFIVEQAGGKCSSGAEPIIGVVPDAVHQRTPVFLGSYDDVDELEAFYRRAR